MLDHTADVGFEVEAPTLSGLFEEAARALLAVLFEEPPRAGDLEETVGLSAPDAETLLVRWINEIIFLVQDTGFVPARVEARVEEGRELQARLVGAPLDVEAQGFQGEVKSATFHGLEVERGEGSVRATVILDV
ncbi:MAG: archease [Actinomycetota bacterium]